MKSDSVRRLPRTVLAVLAVVLAALAGTAAGTLGASPARAAAAGTDITLSLSPSSGSDYSSDDATLSWNVPTACVGQEIDAFLYKGTTTWDSAAIEEAEGDDGSQQTYFDFFDNTDATTATASASWPNVPSPGYYDYGYAGGAVYASTAALVSAFGTGLYTIGIACVNTTNYKPILDSSGNPEAGSVILDIGASGDSWSVDTSVIGTSTTLTGTSTGIGKVALTAAVTAASGVPAGSVNFYDLGSPEPETPLNGSTPVTVGDDGTAEWTGAVPEGPGNAGLVQFTAQFTPASGSADLASTGTGTVEVIVNDVTMTFTATQDPGTPTSVDVTATATLTAGEASTLDGAFTGLAGFVVAEDGSYVTSGCCGLPAVTPFNSSGAGTYTVTGVKAGSHTFSAVACAGGTPVTPSEIGLDLTVKPASPVTVGVEKYASAVSLTGAGTGTGYVLTAAVTSTTSSGAATTVAPAGTITFRNGSTVLATEAVAPPAGSRTGTASVKLTSVKAAPYHFTAAFTPTDSADFAVGTGTLNVTFPAAITWLVPGTVTITGTPKVGDTLTAHPGTWTPAGSSFGYQWQADGTPIPGATGPTLTLGPAQYGTRVGVTVTGYQPGDIAVQSGSPVTAPVAKGTLKTATPVISGTPKDGDVLKVTAGSWTPGTRLTYQWLADGNPINGATGTTLKLTAAEIGKKIRIQVTGTQNGYVTATTTSTATKPVTK